jgi:YD repeat-containing protein
MVPWSTSGKAASQKIQTKTQPNYNARGNVISRESTSGNTTTIYDAGGRGVVITVTVNSNALSEQPSAG